MNEPVRKQLRLQSWDYNETAWYFVTVCVQNMLPCFGRVVYKENAEAYVELSAMGRICSDEISKASEYVRNISVDSYIVMPNHIHMIVCINDNASDGESRSNNTLSKYVASFKRGVTAKSKQAGIDMQMWQRSYHERILRNEKHLEYARRYIENNPIKWAIDKYHVDQ